MKTSAKILLITLGFSLLLILGIIIWAKTYFNSNIERGSGNIVTKTYFPESFHKIKITGGFNVQLNHGEQPKVDVTLDDNFQKYIRVNVIDSLLVISGVNIFRPQGTNISITHTGINELQLQAAVKLESSDTLECEQFTLKTNSGTSTRLLGNFRNFTCTMSAGTKVTLLGTSTHADFRLSAGTELFASEFLTDTCIISASAGSSAGIHVLEYLEAEADAGSSIVYHGSPTIGKQNTSSGSSIRKY